VTFEDVLLDLIFMLAPFGILLFVGLTLGSISSRMRTSSRYLLKRGVIVGTMGATVAALAFVIEPDIALPGPGNYFVILTVFLAIFAAAVAVAFAMYIRR
jgi:hypothetical protein